MCTGQRIGLRRIISGICPVILKVISSVGEEAPTDAESGGLMAPTNSGNVGLMATMNAESGGLMAPTQAESVRPVAPTDTGNVDLMASAYVGNRELEIADNLETADDAGELVGAGRAALLAVDAGEDAGCLGGVHAFE